MLSPSLLFWQKMTAPTYFLLTHFLSLPIPTFLSFKDSSNPYHSSPFSPLLPSSFSSFTPPLLSYFSIGWNVGLEKRNCQGFVGLLPSLSMKAIFKEELCGFHSKGKLRTSTNRERAFLRVEWYFGSHLLNILLLKPDSQPFVKVPAPTLKCIPLSKQKSPGWLRTSWAWPWPEEGWTSSE